MSQRDDNPQSNPSANLHFASILELSLQRRTLLKGAFGAGALSFLGAPTAAQAARLLSDAPPAVPSFKPIAASFADTVRVPDGYTAKVLYRWGDPTGLPGAQPVFRAAGGVSINTPDEQALQAGMDHDGMHFFPLDRRARPDAGLLCINHENVDPAYLLDASLSEADRVRKMKNAHGVSVVEIRRQPPERDWQVVRPSRFARRITADTVMRISGPAAGHPLMRTAADRSGERVLGTLNNCAAGQTPWGTFLTCEENFNGYFQTDSSDPALISAHLRRYGINAAGSGYDWHRQDERFDIAATPNESNRFGWVVEIDPYDPDRPPVKRTALGRFKHENAAVTLTRDRRVVVYMGDDERNEYIYKFVSDKRVDVDDRQGLNDVLDRGTLYVAVLSPGRATGDGAGTGEWIPLAFGLHGLTPENGFHSQGDVLIHTRQTADRVGATMMDRPEWIAVHPASGEVYLTLTNNNRRGTSPASANRTDGTTTAGSSRPPVDDANPRANNVYGHILRWREADDDPAATRFAWEVYLLAGDPADPGAVGAAALTNTRGFPGFEAPEYHIFSAPDGLAFDPQGWLWIQTDYGASTRGVQANMGNCHMLLADIETGRVGRFLTGPNGCEITGWAMTADRRTLFVNIQHPGEDGQSNPVRASVWPDGSAPPRSATVAITKDDGGVIGS